MVNFVVPLVTLVNIPVCCYYSSYLHHLTTMHTHLPAPPSPPHVNTHEEHCYIGGSQFGLGYHNVCVYILYVYMLEAGLGI